MSAELITNWAEHDAALKEILLLAAKTLLIFDADLAKLGLESRENAENLHRFLAADRRRRVRFALRNAEPFRRTSPRLMRLLATYPQQMSVLECPPQLAAACASLCLADDRHALVRFDKDHARGKLVIDSAAECAPYANQFAAIVDQGGEPVSATALGL